MVSYNRLASSPGLPCRCRQTGSQTWPGDIAQPLASCGRGGARRLGQGSELLHGKRFRAGNRRGGGSKGGEPLTVPGCGHSRHTKPEWPLLHVSVVASKKASGPEGRMAPSCGSLPELPAHPAPSWASDSPRPSFQRALPGSASGPLGGWEPGLNLRGRGWFSLPAAAFPEPLQEDSTCSK